MSEDYFYVTTPIYYVNAEPHIGHLYSTLIADSLSRYHRARGKEVFFLTGTDEHGDKVVKAAQGAGLTPEAFTDRISGLFKNTWPELDIRPSRFIRTTEEAHQKTVRKILQGLYDQGDIYHAEYEGKYCFGCERFYTEKELVEGKCPDHQVEPVQIAEANYFFRMSKYQDWLKGHIMEHPDFIQPERYRNEVLSFLKEPLEDLCLSRPKSRLTWGIPLPFDPDYVTYVWFDALVNYLTGVEYPDGPHYSRFWPKVIHIIAKDILKPHAIYWPTMLKAAGIPPYTRLMVHGYWNVKESKMSKSLGNVVRPLTLSQRYGTDAVRYFLLREMVFGLDAGFSEKALIQRINADLANDLGNLFHRALTMVQKYRAGVVPEPGMDGELDPALREGARRAKKALEDGMEAFTFHKALIGIWEFINQINKYIDETAPWGLAKAGPAERLDTVLYHILEGLRNLSILLSPLLPRTAEKMRVGLGAEDHKESWEASLAWGRLAPGTKVEKGPPLFPRLEVKEE
jgi:methionyl-tRNA synthetase